MNEDVIQNLTKEVERLIVSAYNNGVLDGTKISQVENRRLRETSKIESGNQDDEYPDVWKDYTPFYGWCSSCKRPISGRWAHIQEYCGWCGSKFDRRDEPYPLGKNLMSRKVEEIIDLCDEVNPDEINLHGTRESLQTWCELWNRKMKILIGKAMQGI